MSMVYDLELNLDNPNLDFCTGTARMTVDVR